VGKVGADVGFVEVSGDGVVVFDAGAFASCPSGISGSNVRCDRRVDRHLGRSGAELGDLGGLVSPGCRQQRVEAGGDERGVHARAVECPVSGGGCSFGLVFIKESGGETDPVHRVNAVEAGGA
jgi:hypothetical protein